MISKHHIYMRDGGPGRQYIGQTEHLEDRQHQHYHRAKKGRDTKLYRAVRDDPRGWDAFPLRILMSGEWTDFQAEIVEVWFIAFHDTFNNGLNETRGGAGALGCKRSHETRKKMSATHCGEKHPMYGKKHSQETRDKMRASATGRRHSPESIDKMRGPFAPERCAKIRKTKGKFRNKHIVEAMRMLDGGLTLKEVGDRFGRNRRTIWSWSQLWKSMSDSERDAAIQNEERR